MNMDPKHWRLGLEHQIRAVDPHSFFADPNPAVFLNVDPDPAVFLNADPDPDPGGKMNADPCGSGYSLTNFVKNKLMKSFL